MIKRQRQKSQNAQGYLGRNATGNAATTATRKTYRKRGKLEMQREEKIMQTMGLTSAASHRATQNSRKTKEKAGADHPSLPGEIVVRSP
jgi:hypothetical protein